MDSNLEIFINLRSEFNSIAYTLEMSNIFLQGIPAELFFDTGETGNRLRTSFKEICAGLREEISDLSETINLLEKCINDISI